MEKNKQIYEPPQLTVVEFRMEKGYALSSFVGGSYAENAAQQIQMMIDQELANNDGNGNYVAADLGEAVDNSSPVGGSGWEYENGGWF